MAPMELFGDDGDVRKQSKGKAKAKAANGDDFTINTDFAAKYQDKKRGEELSKLKDRYGSNYDGSDDESTDYSSEDSAAEFVTPAVDAAILRTMTKIKRGDPSIYSNVNVFAEEELQQAAPPASKASSSKGKPVLLRDFQRKALLAGIDDDGEASASALPTQAEEDAALKAETRKAFLGDESDSDQEDSEDEEDDDLLVPREKSKNEQEAEEEAYARFLKKNVGKADIKAALDEGGEFLRDYILGRGWLDKDAKRVPKYADVVGETEDDRAQTSGANAITLDEPFDDDDDFEQEEKAEAFETKYNFRFEDQAGADLVTHSRDAAQSVRRKDDSRKQARDQLKARKAEEKQEKRAELERLRELKRQEVVDKLARIRKNAGDEGFDVEGFDFESDFDPNEHDRRMEKAFDTGYYGREDADGKPVWDDDVDIGDIAPEDDGLPAMDADFEPGGDAYDPTAPPTKMSKRQKQRDKKKGRKRDAVEAALDEDEEDVEPEEQKRRLGAAIDEYKKMDYEDIVGDLPTRFKYTKVEPSLFDLTPAEILMATDAELNEVVGLRKIVPYRTGADGKKGSSGAKKKMKEFRALLAERKWGQEPAALGGTRPRMQVKANGGKGEAGAQEGPPKKRKGKKERQRARQEQGVAEQVAAE